MTKVKFLSRRALEFCRAKPPPSSLHLSRRFPPVPHPLPQTSTTPLPHFTPKLRGISATQAPTPQPSSTPRSPPSARHVLVQCYSLTHNVVFGRRVHGQAHDLQVYNARLWDSMNWSCVMQGKTKPSLEIERRFVKEICDGRFNATDILVPFQKHLNLSAQN